MNADGGELGYDFPLLLLVTVFESEVICSAENLCTTQFVIFHESGIAELDTTDGKKLFQQERPLAMDSREFLMIAFKITVDYSTTDRLYDA